MWQQVSHWYSIGWLYLSFVFPLAWPGLRCGTNSGDHCFEVCLFWSKVVKILALTYAVRNATKNRLSGIATILPVHTLINPQQLWSGPDRQKLHIMVKSLLARPYPMIQPPLQNRLKVPAPPRQSVLGHRQCLRLDGLEGDNVRVGVAHEWLPQ